MEGQDSIPSVLGPISISLSGVKAFTKAIVDLKPWTKDPLAVRKAWDEDGYKLKEHGEGKDLCFAILWDNGHVIPHPPIRRALEIAKAALEAKGIKGKLFDISLFFSSCFSFNIDLYSDRLAELRLRRAQCERCASNYAG